MVPPLRKVVSDDPFDRSPEGAAYWSEAVAIEDWIAAGAPNPAAMWDQLQAATDNGERTLAPKLKASADVRRQGLASIEDACTFLGGISRDTFDKRVRHRLRIKQVGSRPFVVVDSLVAFVETDAFKSLNA